MHSVSVSINPLDDEGIRNTSTESYLIVSRRPDIDPFDSTTYLGIVEDPSSYRYSLPRQISFSREDAAAWGVQPGEKLYVAASSAPDCQTYRYGKQPLPGSAISKIYEVKAP